VIISELACQVRLKKFVALHNLQGALGKTAGRSYKAAPRQLLQVDDDAAHEERHLAVKEAARLGAESLGVTVR
jgi:DNA topoisomerase 2-associated protein PAT1